MSKKIIALLLVVVMAVGMFAACGKKSNTIKIGVSGPLTGGAAMYGEAVKNAAQMAVDEINEAGGLNGYDLELIATDDVHDASNVSTNYYKMLEDGMQVSLGCVTSAPCLEFCTLSKEDKVFFLTPSASNDDVTKEDNAYQMCFADGNQGGVAAEYINGLDYDKIGVFYMSGDPYSDGIYAQFKEKIDDSIETVVTSFDESTQDDFTTQIDKLKDCKFIFMPIYYTPASLFMDQAKEIMSEDTIYYGCDGFDGIASAIDVNSIPQEISMLSHFDSNATEGKAAEFIEKYKKEYDEKTLNQFGASAYDCVYAIYEALKQAVEDGEDITPKTSAEDINKILQDIFQGDFKFSGVTGTDITWNADGTVKKEAIRYIVNKK